MIKYALYCDKGHDFESWFSSSSAFDEQSEKALVECPFCASTKVSKALMAPSVSTAKKKEARAERMHKAAIAQAAASHASPQIASNAAPVALLDDDHRKLREAIKELHHKVTENTVDVGENFSEEARKIHDGEAPERAIRGQASLKQAKELWDDGIPVLPIPALPDDKN